MGSEIFCQIFSQLCSWWRLPHVLDGWIFAKKCFDIFVFSDRTDLKNVFEYFDDIKISIRCNRLKFLAGLLMYFRYLKYNNCLSLVLLYFRYNTATRRINNFFTSSPIRGLISAYMCLCSHSHGVAKIFS